MRLPPVEQQFWTGCHVPRHSRRRSPSVSCRRSTWHGVDIDGVGKVISVSLVEKSGVGDYVVVHVGCALTKIDPEEARRTLALLAEAACRCGGCVHEICRRISRRSTSRARWRRPSRAPAIGPHANYHFMEFCGGHTHAISRYGLEDLLPANVRMIHGPGCPVCVLPIGRIDAAIRLARATGGDALHLRRPDARARIARHLAAAGKGGRRRHPHGLFDA